MRVRDKAPIFALAVDIVPERPAAAVEQASRRAFALHVPNALADPIALVLGDGRQDRENKFADAVARSSPIARKRVAGWHPIGEGRQAMSAVALTTDSSQTLSHVREVPANETARAVERCGWRHPHGAIRGRGVTGW